MVKPSNVPCGPCTRKSEGQLAYWTPWLRDPYIVAHKSCIVNRQIGVGDSKCVNVFNLIDKSRDLAHDIVRFFKHRAVFGG